MAKNRQNVKKNIKKDLFTFNNAVLFALMLALIVLFKTIMAPVPAFKAAIIQRISQFAENSDCFLNAEAMSVRNRNFRAYQSIPINSSVE